MTDANTIAAPSRPKLVGPGRPREFDEVDALKAAREVFWQKGYEAASLDDLTRAMGLSRSSFYGAFGGKHALFIRLLEHYSTEGIRNLQKAADASKGGCLLAMMEALSSPDGGTYGCMLINCITELAPHDEKVASVGRDHLEKIEDIFAQCLDPDTPETARNKAGAFVSLAIGTLAMRKAGVPADRVTKILQQAGSVVQI